MRPLVRTLNESCYGLGRRFVLTTWRPDMRQMMGLLPCPARDFCVTLSS